MSASAKRFYADLDRVKRSQFDHVSEIKRGDSDGEITFKYSDSNLEEPLRIQVLATDLSSYPDGTSFMIFTSSDTCSANISKRLEQASASVQGCPLQDVIEAVSNRLASRREESRSHSEFETGRLDDSGDDDEDTDLEDFEPFDVIDDEYFGFQRASEPTIDATTTISQDIDGWKRMQRDLRASKLAGFTVGIFFHLTHNFSGIVSLSIQASKLDLPSAAISAWGLETTDYLVLLVKYPRPYPDLTTLLSCGPRFESVMFRFGKCKTSKPSTRCAIMAFESVLDMNQKPCDRNYNVQPPKEHNKVKFCSIYMSNTINDLLNHCFFTLLKIRRSYRCTWDVAQDVLNRREGQDGDDEHATAQCIGIDSCSDHEEDAPSSSNDPSCLRYDHCLENEGELSFILVAMQFALRRLRKCTEYCMVCHQRRGNGIETIKPYVCSKSLCLYQHLSLAFGTSLETEVINSPYVVDLLVSLFYAALTSDRLRELPRGLALKVPHIFASTNLDIKICLPTNVFRVAPDKQSTSLESIIRKGDWALLMVRTSRGFEKHICRVTQQMGEDLYSFQEMYCVVNPIEFPENEGTTVFPAESDDLERDWLSAKFLPFSCDPDDLLQKHQTLGLRQLLDAMPSVLEMRRFLLEAPGRSLGRWARINRSSLSLVRWIVASNTSYIVQDSAVPVVRKAAAPEPETTNLGTTEGLVASWMQFRFAQGSPEKERAFFKAVQNMCSTDASKTDCPTLFAWHGSPIGNWHSIIRTGLDFSNTSNGRSYGHGVYLSRMISTSRRYSDAGLFPDARVLYSPWPRSDLKISSALSICEIINRPDRFVCASPGIVINKTQWIQCRYLLLQVDPNEDAIRTPIIIPPSALGTGHVKQDPENMIMGENDQPLEIPMTATSCVNRQRDCFPEAKSLKDLEATCNEDGSEDGDDLQVLTESIRAMIISTQRGRKRPQSTSPPEYGDAPIPSVSASPQPEQHSPTASTTPKQPPSPSIFHPGTLDLTTLPRLPDPAWAVSSRAALLTLSREIREISKTQSQNDAASLGWYVDTAKVVNLFQWIAELHTFDPDLPLAKDMMEKGHASVVLEVRFGSNFPISPPFVRVIRPRFLPFLQGGGGHVTAGGAICSEMLTSSGWSPAMSMEKVFLQIRLGLCDTERPARLATGPLSGRDYGIREAVDAYERAARTHGWIVPRDLRAIETGWREKSD